MTEFELELAAMLPDLLMTSAVRIPHRELNAVVIKKVENAVLVALTTALNDAGVVLNIACDNIHEILYTRAVLEAWCLHTSTKLPAWLPDKSTTSRFEFSNNSAIFITLRQGESK